MPGSQEERVDKRVLFPFGLQAIGMRLGLEERSTHPGEEERERENCLPDPWEKITGAPGSSHA